MRFISSLFLGLSAAQLAFSHDHHHSHHGDHKDMMKQSVHDLRMACRADFENYCLTTITPSEPVSTPTYSDGSSGAVPGSSGSAPSYPHKERKHLMGTHMMGGPHHRMNWADRHLIEQPSEKLMNEPHPMPDQGMMGMSGHGGMAMGHGGMGHGGMMHNMQEKHSEDHHHGKVDHDSDSEDGEDDHPRPPPPHHFMFGSPENDQCMMENYASLSQDCQAAIDEFTTEQRHHSAGCFFFWSFVLLITYAVSKKAKKCREKKMQLMKIWEAVYNNEELKRQVEAAAGQTLPAPHAHSECARKCGKFLYFAFVTLVTLIWLHSLAVFVHQNGQDASNFGFVVFALLITTVFSYVIIKGVHQCCCSSPNRAEYPASTVRGRLHAMFHQAVGPEARTNGYVLVRDGSVHFQPHTPNGGAVPPHGKPVHIGYPVEYEMPNNMQSPTPYRM